MVLFLGVGQVSFQYGIPFLPFLFFFQPRLFYFFLRLYSAHDTPLIVYYMPLYGLAFKS
jgi:hypothetical protein